MLPCGARIRARRFEEFGEWVRHDGEKFLYVLTVIITLFTELFQPIEMRRADSAYYDDRIGHNMTLLSDDDATILWDTSLI